MSRATIRRAPANVQPFNGPAPALMAVDGGPSEGMATRGRRAPQPRVTKHAPLITRMDRLDECEACACDASFVVCDGVAHFWLCVTCLDERYPFDVELPKARTYTREPGFHWGTVNRHQHIHAGDRCFRHVAFHNAVRSLRRDWLKGAR